METIANTKSQNESIQLIANTIGCLAIDMVHKANSGHPGLPLGCKELLAYLYAKQLRYNPNDSNWLGRDIFVLSAGHGSAGLYASLHLSGFLELEELKNFRKLGSKTPGHPEFGHTPGVETTTGPLGCGLGTAVGMALARKILTQRYELPLDFFGNVYVLASDGELMEGVSHEALSLAGHFGLNNLAVIWDNNKICLDGRTEETWSDDTPARLQSYGWEVYNCSGHDLISLEVSLKHVGKSSKPVFIDMRTIIGRLLDNQASSQVHGKPPTAEDVAKFKKVVNFPEEKFYVPEEVVQFMQKRNEELAQQCAEWQTNQSSEQLEQLNSGFDESILQNCLEELSHFAPKVKAATRSENTRILEIIAKHHPMLVVGSADLSSSDGVKIAGSGIVSSTDFKHQNVKFGVREFGMALCANGLAQMGMLPVVGTFLTFSHQMMQAIRLSSLMNLKVVYVLTHDSILVGEDGPTHQPVEHLAQLRAIPGLTVIRPSDGKELQGAWELVLNNKINGPVVLILTRQETQTMTGTKKSGVEKGAYLVENEPKETIRLIRIVATGSEVSLACEVKKVLESNYKAKKVGVFVISMPSWELYDKGVKSTYVDGSEQSPLKYPLDTPTVVIEAGVSQGWHKYVSQNALFITQETFGASGSQDDLRKVFGFEAESIAKKIASFFNLT